MEKLCDRTSTILPLPSSPHWAPTITAVLPRFTRNAHSSPVVVFRSSNNLLQMSLGNPDGKDSVTYRFYQSWRGCGMAKERFVIPENRARDTERDSWGLQLFLCGFVQVQHPVDTELVCEHPKAGSPESFLQRHGHLAFFRQSAKQLLNLL